jgi:hypothetical protein
MSEDEVDKLRGNEICNPEERAGDYYETKDHPGGLHHLATVRPLYPLKLSPASAEELAQPDGPSVVGLVLLDGSGRPALVPCLLLLELLELLLARNFGKLRPPERQLRFGELHIRRRVLQRLRRVKWVRRMRGIGGASLGPGASLRDHCSAIGLSASRASTVTSHVVPFRSA